MEPVEKFPVTVLIKHSEKVFGFSESTMRKLIETGDIISYRNSGRRVICSDSVRCFILSRMHPQPSSGSQVLWMKTFMTARSHLPVLIRIGEVNRYFCFSRRSAYRLCDAQEIAFLHVRRSRFLITESVLHYTEREKYARDRADSPDLEE